MQVQNISTDYANKQVTFNLSWAAGTRNATHLSKVWVLVDYQEVTNPNTTGAWQRATVVSATATNGTVSGNTGRGFFVQGTDGAFSSTVTVTLSGVPAKFNWCATATDYPPNAVLSNGTYTLKGTTPFTINGGTTVSARTYTGACITSITDPTGCPGTVTNPAFSTGTIASTGQTLCIGGTPVNITSTAPATGGDNRITYQWYKNGAVITGATATTYTPPTGDAAAVAAHTYTRRAKDATCNTTLTNSAGSWVLNVVADPTITISAAQSICYNTAGSALTATVSGGSGANTYTWQYSADNSAWTAAGSGTANTLATGNLTANRYYHVMVTQAGSGCASAYSASVLKTVYPNFTTGTIASTGQTLCVGGTPSNIGSTAAATGGNGTISYQWYKNGAIITGATATTYTPPTSDAAATASHTYTRRAKDATCNTTLTASAGSWVLTVVADPTITISAAQSICYNTAGSALTATVSGGSGANTYTWQYSADNSAWTAAGTSTANTLATGNLTANRYYRVMVTQATNGCASAYSGSVLKTVLNPAVPTISNNGNKCVGAAVTFTAGAVTGATGYEWTGSGITAGTVAVATTTRASNTTAGAKSAQVRSFTTASGITCYSAYSATSTATVYATPAPTLSGGTTSIMVGASTTWNASIAGGTWGSSNTAVATVSNGTITGKAAGTATITYSVTQNGCTGSTTRTITVISAGGSGSGNGSTITNCSTANITFTSGFVSNTTWVVGSQTWSAPVTATYCRKTAFNGGTTGAFLTDCRSANTSSSAIHTTYGDLFSWCMVAKFATTICPSGWRVPTSTDFCNLDKALFSTATCTNRTNASNLSVYMGSRWGGQYAGTANSGSLNYQGSLAYYWSQTEYYAATGYYLYFNSYGDVGPQGSLGKYTGATLRCVK